jgi:hypothetical protein
MTEQANTFELNKEDNRRHLFALSRIGDSRYISKHPYHLSLAKMS